MRLLFLAKTNGIKLFSWKNKGAFLRRKFGPKKEMLLRIVVKEGRFGWPRKPWLLLT